MRRPLERIATRRRTWFWLFLLVLLATHVVSIYTESVNWDEFVLLEHAARTLETGVLQSGGRGGLGTVLLIPFVRGCDDPLAVAHAARWLWTGFTVALVIGLWLLVYRTLDGPEERRWHAASLAVALLVCVPAFLATSLQVRTDQPAVAFGLWGGLAIIASRERWPWAVLGGALLAVGFLFSQKLVYVAALVGTLAVAETLLKDRFHATREIGRILLTAAAGGAVVLIWQALLPHFFAPPDLQSVGEGMNQFDIYREAVGYYFYVLMGPTLAAHLALSVMVLRTGAVGAWRGRRRGRGRLVMALAVLALAVGLFHAGAFPYFWMTLGLFPAAVVAAGLDPLRERVVESGRWRAVTAVAWGFLVLQGLGVSVYYAADDTQAEQRASFAFVDRTFPESAQGYSSHRAFFCGRQEDLRQVSFRASLQATFGADRSRGVAPFVDSFREIPIAFLIDDGWLRAFPDEVERFWREHYRPYHASVAVPGWRLDPIADSVRTIEVFVPGPYRWVADRESRDGPKPLVVDGRRLADGERIGLDRGEHRVRPPFPGGELLYAVDEERAVTDGSFYRSFDSMALPYRKQSTVSLPRLLDERSDKPKDP